MDVNSADCSSASTVQKLGRRELVDPKVVEMIAPFPGKSYLSTCFRKNAVLTDRVSLVELGRNHGLLERAVRTQLSRRFYCLLSAWVWQKQPGLGKGLWKELWRQEGSWQVELIRSSCWQFCPGWPGQVA